MREFIAADAPCFALGMVEERKRQCGFVALRPDKVIPPGAPLGRLLKSNESCSSRFFLIAVLSLTLRQSFFTVSNDLHPLLASFCEINVLAQIYCNIVFNIANLTVLL